MYFDITRCSILFIFLVVQNLISREFDIWDKKSNHYIYFSPFTYVDPTHFNMARLFVTLVMDSLNEYAYDAEIAGIQYLLHATFYGIQVSPEIFYVFVDLRFHAIIDKLCLC